MTQVFVPIRRREQGQHDETERPARFLNRFDHCRVGTTEQQDLAGMMTRRAPSGTRWPGRRPLTNQSQPGQKASHRDSRSTHRPWRILVRRSQVLPERRPGTCARAGCGHRCKRTARFFADRTAVSILNRILRFDVAPSSVPPGQNSICIAEKARAREECLPILNLNNKDQLRKKPGARNIRIGER